MFSHGFPYTNFHDLNLDWIIKTVKILFNKSVFSINNIEPDDDGNVTITGTELGAIGTVNNIAPVDGNVTLTASDVGAVAVGQGVTKVNGFSPDSSGNVLSGTVRSINGISPTSLPTPGNVVLNASDVGALPSTIDPVETVNGISPDANGNVNVGTVKSVNGSAPDAQGNVNLPTVAGVTSVNGIGPDAHGNVDVGTVKSVNTFTPDNTGNIQINATIPVQNVPTTPVSENLDSSYTHRFQATRFGNVGFLLFSFKTGVTADWGTAFLSGMPLPATTYLVNCKAQSGNFYLLEIRADSGQLRAIGAIPTGETLEGSVAYPIAGNYSVPISNT